VDQEALLEVAHKHLIRYASEFALGGQPGRGVMDLDQEGNKILDFTSGQICSTIRHNHSRITEPTGRPPRPVIAEDQGLWLGRHPRLG
jgi:2,2-dialkylglycine decarboxylase (pyruvate)